MPDNPQITTYFPHLRVFPNMDVLDLLDLLEIKGKNNRVRQDEYGHIARYPDGSRKDLRFQYAIVSRMGGYVDLINVHMQCDEGLNPSKEWDTFAHKQFAWERFAREYAEQEVFA
jgi:hypothetical protein